MKRIVSKQVKKLIVLMLVVCLIIVALFNVAGYFLNCKYISVVAAVAQADKYEVRNGLLLHTMDKLGVCTPDAAIQVWVEGMENRNGAMQYAVMSSDLKKEYLSQLNRYNQYWVTGMSSPWIVSYKITSKTQTGDTQYVFLLSLPTATSAGPAEKLRAKVTVERQNDFWQITKIAADKGLGPYMGWIQ